MSDSERAAADRTRGRPARRRCPPRRRARRIRADYPGRSGHRLSIEAGRIVDGAREALAQLFHAPDPLRVVFTANATEALNLALQGLLHPGDHVVTSSVEHNSMMRPLRALEATGIARCHDRLLLVDAAADAGAFPIDVVQEQIDLLAFTRHKSLYGPMGTGGLVLGDRVDPARLRPLKRSSSGPVSRAS
jgi:selenocysteine lyase/cysteine desulfurase